MRSLRGSVFLSVVLLVLCSPLAAQIERDWAASDREFSVPGLLGPLRFLAHDLIEGRGPGSRGDELARLYLATRLEGFGFEPAGVDGGFEQPVPIIGVTATVVQPLRARASGGDAIVFSAPDDYTARAGHPAERTAWSDAALVFVGYGISAPEQGWDDFGTVDVRGKVLLVMNNDPEDDPALFGGKQRLYYGRWSYKYEEAARRGAVGAIVIHTTPSAGYPFQVIQGTHGAESFSLPEGEGTPALAIESWCSEDAARLLVGLGGHDLDALRARAQSRDFLPVDLGVRVDLATENRVREIRSANVVGVLPGSDPKLRDEYVVVTAHFDHLGRGRERNGDDIYNGALDNASGCAMVLELARACARLVPAPRRSLLFAFVTGEESGLLGSKFFAQSPTVPIERIVADFNVDGINIWGATRDIEMVGYGKNSLGDVAQLVAARRGRTVEPDKQPENGYFYRSDQFSFAKVGVPTAYFKAGSDFLENRDGRQRLKASYTAVHYHQPSDELDPRWRLGGAILDAQLMFECLVRSADAERAPTWTEGDEFSRRR